MLHTKPSQAGKLLNIPTDSQHTIWTKDESDKKHINLSDLFQEKINIRELTPLEDIQLIEKNEYLNENHEFKEESEDEVEKVNIDLDRLNKFLSQC